MTNVFQKKVLNFTLFLELSFYTETSLFDVLSLVIICYALCQCHDKVENLLYSVLLELK